MKSKRLKNFCEVCRKQCKDQNGYHCHLNSGHHQKRLRELATNPQQHIQKYSNELQNRIVQILKSKYPGEPKDLQDIYQQYSQDKFHVKFNYTRWKDLTEFAEHLRTVRNLKVDGKLPYCNVTYVVNKAGDFMKQKKEELAVMKREKEKEMEGKRLQERIARMREVQAERYRDMKEKLEKQEKEEEEFDLDNQVFRFDFAEKTYQPSKLFTNQEEEPVKPAVPQQASKTKKTNMEKLLNEIENQESKNKKKAEGEGKKEMEQQEFEWILPGIVVKVLPHQIPAVFHGKKAAIITVKEPYVAEIKLGEAILSIDQANLQTVIPKLGHEVKILKGLNRNKNGRLSQVNLEDGLAKIELDGQFLSIPFNQFSKVE